MLVMASEPENFRGVHTSKEDLLVSSCSLQIIWSGSFVVRVSQGYPPVLMRRGDAVFSQGLRSSFPCKRFLWGCRFLLLSSRFLGVILCVGKSSGVVKSSLPSHSGKVELFPCLCLLRWALHVLWSCQDNTLWVSWSSSFLAAEFFISDYYQPSRASTWEWRAISTSLTLMPFP